MKKLPAVLVNMTISQFTNEKTDKSIVQEVAKQHNASFSKDRYMKKVIPPDILVPINKHIADIRAYHYKVTSPWFDRGIRMMAASFIMDYQEAIEQMKADLTKLINTAAKEINKQKAEYQRIRGSLYDEDSFPTEAEFKKDFSVSIELLPIPMSSDFRVDLISAQTKKELDANNKKRFQDQNKHISELILTPISKLKTSLSNFKRSPKIYTATVEEINWWVNNVSKLSADDTQQKRYERVATYASKITAFHNPEGRPQFNVEGIEDSLDLIAMIEKELECHTK